MACRGFQLLRLSFAIGTVADAVVATNWFLIAGGADIPNLMTGLVGEGPEYRHAMYIAGLFMTGWTVLLAWGWLEPFERKGLLIIAAALLLISMVLEILFYGSMLAGSGFVFGLCLRAALIAKFSFSYFYSRDA